MSLLLSKNSLQDRTSGPLCRYLWYKQQWIVLTTKHLFRLKKECKLIQFYECRGGVFAPGAIKTPLTRSILVATPWQSPPISNSFYPQTYSIHNLLLIIYLRLTFNLYIRVKVFQILLSWYVEKLKFYVTFGCSKRKAFIDVPDKQTRQLSVAIVLINDVKIRFIPVEKLKFDRLYVYLICF